MKNQRKHKALDYDNDGEPTNSTADSTDSYFDATKAIIGSV